MKFTIRKNLILIYVLIFTSLLMGCNSIDYTFPYNDATIITGFQSLETTNLTKATSFATNLCVVSDENIMSEGVDLSSAIAGGLFDLNNLEALYVKNPHEQLQIASLTKIMTAYVALKYGTLDQTLTATNSIYISESGAQLSGLEVGDVMTLDQALHILLMYSANDVALLIAEGVGGSVDNFIELMNKEALYLGATNTNFNNPTGLTENGQYSTVYDVYLMLNAALSYDRFKEIISMETYTTTYKNGSGENKEISITTTNRYLRGEYSPPNSITILGGKTGTTNAAGHCLAIFSRDIAGNPYISIILGSESRDEIYEQMSDLLDEIQ